jgi:hypothetical protein
MTEHATVKQLAEVAGQCANDNSLPCDLTSFNEAILNIVVGREFQLCLAHHFASVGDVASRSFRQTAHGSTPATFPIS